MKLNFMLSGRNLASSNTSTSQLSMTQEKITMVGTCLTLPNLGFLWVFFNTLKYPILGICYFFLCETRLCLPLAFLSRYQEFQQILTQTPRSQWLSERE